MLSSQCIQDLKIENLEFSSLNAISSNIKLIDKLKPSFAFICELYLDNNLLVSLNGIQQFQNLEALSFNFNHIQLFGELYKVNNKFFMKKLSFIGNPLQWDLRARFDYIAVNIFPNLQSLNPISGNKIRLKFKTYQERLQQRNKLKNSQAQYEQIEDKTQRQCPKIYNDGQHTRRIHFKTQYEGNTFERSPPHHNRNNINFSYIKERIKTKSRQMSENGFPSNNRIYQDSSYQKSKIMNRSTTGNSYGRSFDRRPYEKLQYSITKYNNEGKEVLINPFKSIQQPQYSFEQQQQKQKQQNNALSSQSSIQQRSRIPIIDGTGHFDLAYDSIEQSIIQFKKKHRSLAKRFLNQQKTDVARAFRVRHIKQKIFEVFKFQKQYRIKQQEVLKRKAWAIIKMTNTMINIFKQH